MIYKSPDPVPLVKAAFSARNMAYAPYSNFRVGAALLTGEGKIYTGCNIENSSYGLTCCAERVALYKAVSEGERHFQAMAVVSDSAEYCSPCGACRQVLAEFGDRLLVYMVNSTGEYTVRTLSDLLPESFRLIRNL
jgi:cytidine deaminase